MKPSPLAPVALALVILLSASGCGEKITVYQVPKEREPMAQSATRPDDRQMPPLPTLEWDSLPEGWREESGGAMRAATFSIADASGNPAAEMAVLPFPGAAGLQDLQLVNMWREQVGLKPATEAELKQLTQPIEAAGHPGKLFDISGGPDAQGNRIMVAVVPEGRFMWFFKLTGRSAVIDAQKDAFVDFLKTVRFVPPKSAPPQAAASPPAAERPKWKTPPHWKDLGAGMMQLAKYRADGEGGSTEITVSRLGGAAGGVAPNVNRWRGQLGLSSLPNAEAEALARPFEVPVGKARIVDLVGENKSMLVIMVSQGGSTWFFKSMGEKAAVERERAAFVEFVKSVQY